MIIDVNCSVGSWPFRDLPVTTAGALSSHAQGERIDSALVSSLDAVFRPDPDFCNLRLAEELDVFDNLIPVPVINPRIARFGVQIEEYLALGLPAIKIHPNYHGYSLDYGNVDRLASILAERNIPLMVTIRLEDERFHPPNMGVPPVPMEEIRELAIAHPSLDLVCLNAYGREIRQFMNAGGTDKSPEVRNEEAPGVPDNVYFDIAFVEFFKTIDEMLTYVSKDRILFGSHTPFFVTRAALMKLVWSDCEDEIIEGISSPNAENLFR